MRRVVAGLILSAVVLIQACPDEFIIREDVSQLSDARTEFFRSAVSWTPGALVTRASPTAAWTVIPYPLGECVGDGADQRLAEALSFRLPAEGQTGQIAPIPGYAISDELASGIVFSRAGAGANATVTVDSTRISAQAQAQAVDAYGLASLRMVRLDDARSSCVLRAIESHLDAHPELITAEMFMVTNVYSGLSYRVSFNGFVGNAGVTGLPVFEARLEGGSVSGQSQARGAFDRTDLSDTHILELIGNGHSAQAMDEMRAHATAIAPVFATLTPIAPFRGCRIAISGDDAHRRVAVSCPRLDPTCRVVAEFQSAVATLDRPGCRVGSYTAARFDFSMGGGPPDSVTPPRVSGTAPLSIGAGRPLRVALEPGSAAVDGYVSVTPTSDTHCDGGGGVPDDTPWRVTTFSGTVVVRSDCTAPVE